MITLDLFAPEINPCLHCGGEQLEQWRDCKFDSQERRKVIFMCKKCTFETSDSFLCDGMEGRSEALERWNLGIKHKMSKMHSKGLMNFSEYWDFEVNFMRQKRPQLRGL